MPDIPENLDPKEATEARLCAYLEGELPLSERAEIEKYLSNNAQHRQLLADLAKTRNWLGALPREAAPPEIAEAFAGQLERSMLLDGTVGNETIISVNRGPQILLAAAIVVLALGLATVIYYTLPQSPPTKFGVAGQSNINPPTIDQPAGPNSNPWPATTAPAVALAATPANPPLAAPLVTTPIEKGSANTTVENVPKPAMAGGGPPPIAQTVIPTTQNFVSNTENAPANKALEDRLAKLGYATTIQNAGSNNTVYLVVSSQNPSDTTQQLKDYLASNKIIYDAPQPVPGNQLGLQGQNNFNQNTRMAAKVMVATSQIAQPDLSTDDLSGAVYIARDITRQQADQLNAALSAKREQQSTEVITPLPPEIEHVLVVSPTTVPTTGPAEVIKKDDRLKITVAELVGPGVDKTNIVRVNEDGAINLPMIEPIRAADSTPSDLEKQIADKYRDANLIPQATVKVELISDETRLADRQIVPATQSAAGPTTAPATTQPEKVNVVILVEKSTSATTEPTTQPAMPTTNP